MSSHVVSNGLSAEVRHLLNDDANGVCNSEVDEYDVDKGNNEEDAVKDSKSTNDATYD